MQKSPISPQKRPTSPIKRQTLYSVCQNMCVNMYANSDVIAYTSAEFLCLAVQHTTEYFYVNMYVNACVVAATRACSLCLAVQCITEYMYVFANTHTYTHTHTHTHTNNRTSPSQDTTTASATTRRRARASTPRRALSCNTSAQMCNTYRSRLLCKLASIWRKRALRACLERYSVSRVFRACWLWLLQVVKAAWRVVVRDWCVHNDSSFWCK